MNNNIKVKKQIRELKKQNKHSDNSGTKAAYRFLSKQMLNNAERYNNRTKAKAKGKTRTRTKNRVKTKSKII